MREVAVEYIHGVIHLSVIQLGGHVHTNWNRKLIFCVNNGFDLYFHNPHQFLRGALSTPPLGGNHPEINQQKLGHVTYQIKALAKLYSNMPIKCSFDPLFDHQQLKMTWKIAIFVDSYIEEGMSTPIEIADFLQEQRFGPIFS